MLPPSNTDRSSALYLPQLRPLAIPPKRNILPSGIPPSWPTGRVCSPQVSTLKFFSAYRDRLRPVHVTDMERSQTANTTFYMLQSICTTSHLSSPHGTAHEMLPMATEVGEGKSGMSGQYFSENEIQWNDQSESNHGKLLSSSSHNYIIDLFATGYYRTQKYKWV